MAGNKRQVVEALSPPASNRQEVKKPRRTSEVALNSAYSRSDTGESLELQQAWRYSTCPRPRGKIRGVASYYLTAFIN